jgi:two-component system, OmpR family, sensor histidine kinase CreC
MRFSLRIFLGYFLLVVAGSTYLFSVIGDEVKPTVRQAAEEVLVDTANLLADLIREDFVAGRLADGSFRRAVAAYRERRPGAMIWEIRKDSVDLRVYVTDAAGVVQFDSAGESVGEDFSQWRDIYLTLRGAYGARTSEVDFGRGPTTVMHVAAPILVNGRVVGVVSVAKPNYTVQPYIDRAYARLAQGAALLTGLGLLLGGAFSWWLSRGIGRVIVFADAVAEGVAAAVPHLPGNRELQRLADAMGRMRDRLEGKAYVEEYVYALTHELKSPLAGIRASAEVLADPLDPDSRSRFVAHIEAETGRLDRIVQRLLELARVEQRSALVHAEPIDLRALAADVVSALQPQAASRQVSLVNEVIGPAGVRGERFLLEQALRNLGQNALDFSPSGGEVRITADRRDGMWAVTVTDQGPGVPAFAEARAFDRFFSLARPDGTVRGTGLGLPLVRSIARLHGGDATLQNRAGGGAVAVLTLPAGP